MASDVIRNHQMAQGFFYRYDLYEKRILVVLYGVFYELTVEYYLLFGK